MTMPGETRPGVGGEAPIFVVGVPRSGTTLLAAMLASHSRLSCGPETHLFRFLARKRVTELCDRGKWPGPAIDFLKRLRHSEGRVLEDDYGFDDLQVSRFLEQRTPSVGAILAALTERHMVLQGKQRWLEKTPRHIRHVDMIRRYFPESPIVRIVRDARDVALSLVKVPWGPRSFGEGLLRCRHDERASDSFFATDRLAYTVRFEDLIEQPEVELRQLCMFLGEHFEAQMLSHAESASGFVKARQEAWHSRLAGPIDPSRVCVWRRELSKAQNRFAEALVGDRLRQYGYPLETSFKGYAEFVPSFRLAGRYADSLSQIPELAGWRFWKATEAEVPGMVVFVGAPDEPGWLGRGTWRRRLMPLRVALTLVRARLRRTRVLWVNNQQRETTVSRCGATVAALLRRAASVHGACQRGGIASPSESALPPRAEQEGAHVS